MRSRTLHQWTLLGVCAATVAVVGPGCNRDRPLMPRAGSDYEGVANTQQDNRQVLQPGTGGSGQQPTSAAQDGAGAQGQQNKIGAPGYTTPNEETLNRGGTRQAPMDHEHTRAGSPVSQ
jgi:hypothetical protein